MELLIRDWLARYLAGQISLGEFHDWFIPATWDLGATGDASARTLAHQVQLRLAEFSSGHWTEEELQRQLAPLVQGTRVAL